MVSGGAWLLQIEVGNSDSFYENGRMLSALQVIVKLKNQLKQVVVS